jgi:hypothetical protein
MVIYECNSCHCDMQKSLTYHDIYYCNYSPCTEFKMFFSETDLKRAGNVSKTTGKPNPNISSNANFRGTEMKEVRISSTYSDTIITINFVTIPRRGWFSEHVTPIIEIIKSSIPASTREYDRETYTWSIGVEYWPSLEQILIASGWTIKLGRASEPAIPDVPKEYAESFHYKQVVETTVEYKESIAKQLASLLGIHEDLATIELVALKRKYREMARLYHPDLGGDAEKMSELNRVWTIYNSGDKVQ